MPLDGDLMGAAVNTALQNLSEDDQTDPVVIWQTACTEIVNHIKANAVVSTTTTTTGVTANGPPGGPLPIVSQPGTGMGTIA